MVDITDPWEDAVDIREYTPRDFSGRNGSISAYDQGGWLQGAADAIAEYEGVENRSSAIDRVVRYYLAAVIDETGNTDRRAAVETAVQIPPVGWVDANDPRPESITVAVADDGGQIDAYTHDAVAELFRWVFESLTDFETQSAMTEGAVRWYLREDDLHRHLEV